MQWPWFMLICVVGASVHADGPEEWKTVRIAQGPVRGRYNTEYGIYAFYDIPYATAPTGRDRFKAPRPPPTWITTFDAVDRGIACPQLMQTSNVQEDCLVASVYVPNTQETNLPVAINIHGGAYLLGYGNTEKLNGIVSSNRTIGVTFNYRLGPHGFLCLGTEDVPGNAGFKDQVALLRWVKQNIASFGGNPNDVTIMGCSAGGGSVDFLTLSKITDGLFTKAIIESGAIIGAVGTVIDPIENAKAYARAVNFSNADDIAALEEFYKTSSFEILFQDLNAQMMTKDGTLLFGPCIEKDVGQERFLDDAPVNIIKNGNYTKVPLLYGFSDLEGLIRIFNFEGWQEPMNENFSDFLPPDLEFQSLEEKEEIAERVRSFYFEDKPVNRDTLLSFVNFISDQMFSYPMLRELRYRLQSSDDTIYLYDYSFYEENSQTASMFNLQGAGHCQQSVIVRDENRRSMTEEYKQMRDTMRKMWLNFITSGRPVLEQSQLPSWPRANAERYPYMSLGRAIELRGPLLENRTALWDSIYEKHYRFPQPPSTEDGPTTGAATSSTVSKTLLAFIILYIAQL